MSHMEDSVGVNRNKRFQKKQCAAKWRNHWVSFSRETSIHGVHYLGDSSRPFFERVGWAVVISAGLFLATKYCTELWNKWALVNSQDMRVDTLKSADLIPFPAITFCNNVKAVANEKERYKIRDDLFFLCGNLTDQLLSDRVMNIQHLITLAPHLNASCEAGIPPFNCTSMLRRIVTDYGLCYTYNMFATEDIFKDGVESSYYDSHGRRADWMPLVGYDVKALFGDTENSTNPFVTGPFPKRASSIEFAVKIYLKESSNDDMYCGQDSTQGFKVMIHNPMEVPMAEHRYSVFMPIKFQDSSKWKFIDVPANHEVIIALDIRVVWASESLRAFPPKLRKCYFPDEKNLEYFRHYSSSNCEVECLTNEIIEDCECSDFYLPHPKNVSVCTMEKLPCILSAYEMWKKNYRKNCNCFPSCESIEYNTNIYLRKNIENKTTNFVEIIVFVDKDEYVSSERKAVYGLVDFLASCGGIFGLFCGISIISLIDFLYYATIRVFGNLLISRQSLQQDLST